MTDHELLSRYLLTRSSDAFAALIQRHTGMVYGVCLRVLNDPHAAEDATQATFLALLKKADQLTRETVLAGWLHRAAGWAARDIRKLRERRARHERESSMARTDAANSDWESLRPELDAALAALPVMQRDAVALRYLQGRSHAEVAAELGCAVETVHTWLSRGLKTLRERLNRRGVALSLAALAALLEQNASAAAPAALTASVGALSANASVTPIVQAAADSVTQFLFWQKAKWIVGSAAAAALAGAVGLGLWLSADDAPVSRATAVTTTPAVTDVRWVPPLPRREPAPSARPLRQAARLDPQTAIRVAKTIDSSLVWLTRVQLPAGHFDGASMGARPGQDVAVTSIALLSFLGSGYTTKVGPYRNALEHLLKWLRVNEGPDLTQQAVRALALAEHFAMTRQDRDIAQTAIDALMAQQSPTGEWLETGPAALSEYEKCLEPTTWSILAMRSATVAGLTVDRKAVDRALKGLNELQRAALSQQGTQGLLYGASVANARMFLGQKAGSAPVKALTDRLLENAPVYDGAGLGIEIVAWYQGSLAAFMESSAWTAWSPALTTALVDHQIPDGWWGGSWEIRQESDGFKWGRVGATALAALSLEVYYRYQFLARIEEERVPAADRREESKDDF